MTNDPTSTAAADGCIDARFGFCAGCEHNRWLIVKGDRWAGCRHSFEAAQEFADRLRAEAADAASAGVRALWGAQ